MSKVKELREQHNLKQEDMAAIIGVSPANYSKKEAGNIRFSLMEARKIAQYFNLKIEDIFFQNDVSKIETKY